jgi:hypothetical protein
MGVILWRVWGCARGARRCSGSSRGLQARPAPSTEPTHTNRIPTTTAAAAAPGTAHGARNADKETETDQKKKKKEEEGQQVLKQG